MLLAVVFFVVGTSDQLPRSCGGQSPCVFMYNIIPLVSWIILGIATLCRRELLSDIIYYSTLAENK